MTDRPHSYRADLPSAIYVWIVPSEEVQDQPGSWRIRKWDTEPFPEANFTMRQSGPLVPSEPTMGMWDDFCEVHKVPFDTFLAAYRRMVAGLDTSTATNFPESGPKK